MMKFEPKSKILEKQGEVFFRLDEAKSSETRELPYR